MIFNLASAALIYQSYQQNITGVYINNTESVLCVVDIFLVCFSLVGIIMSPICYNFRCRDHPNNPTSIANLFIFICVIILNGPFNMVFSSNVIIYHRKQDVVNELIINMTLAIMVLNPVFFILAVICLCLYKSSHKVNVLNTNV